ncbi:polysaccharide export inner-membrane protein, BexC/CtrB/KpsE family [Bordetella bronchiseptica 99-R-0433]|uniref:capsule biosynthesis protein n=1 Tax=Bordetella bronchiseptica TaxID=518 RepID=UPI00045A8067|nr:capsule biosynthesis protein [Bordetella bronchiseptica]KCV60933.1 polysaccharide export inner-membrane protein, BexC/CtrB/KpsE family [Bordetella bronchiseptica 99-R-0433]
MTSTEKTYTGPRLPGMTPGKPANYLRWSAIALIGIPGVLLALYLFFIASDQYVSEARFGLRAGSQMQQASANRDGHSSMGTGAMATELFVDSFAVVDYVKSRQIVQELDKELNLREMWSKPMIDFWYGMDEDETAEGLWRQWNRMVDIEFDMSTGAIILRVRAFSPEESLRLAEAILQASEKLVNQMSVKSREDSVDFARAEVGIAEKRLAQARVQVQDLRARTGVLDPVKEAEANLQLAAKVRGDVATAAAELDAMGRGGLRSGPAYERVKARHEALMRQLKDLNDHQISGGRSENGNTLSKLLREYEAAETERQFAEAYYTGALKTLEDARGLAARQVLYTVIASQPQLADESLYPRRFTDTALGLLGLFILWIVAVLVVYAVKDHA